MKLTSLHIDGFGMFENHSLSLSSGINLIYGLNESGKSTLHAFIEGMFYGFLNPDVKQKRYLDLHKWYQPRSNAPYKGALLFEKDGTEYRLHRTFKKGSDSVRLYKEVNGEEITDSLDIDPVSKLPDIAAFIDMPYRLYRNTLSLRQLSPQTDEEAQDDLLTRLRNLNATQTESFSVEKAVRHLEKAISEIGTARAPTKPYAQALKRKESLDEEYENAKKHHEYLLEERRRIDEIREDKRALNAEKEDLEKTLRKQENMKEKQRLDAIDERVEKIRRMVEKASQGEGSVDYPAIEKAIEAYPECFEQAESHRDHIRDLRTERKSLSTEEDVLDDDAFQALKEDRSTLKQLTGQDDIRNLEKLEEAVDARRTLHKKGKSRALRALSVTVMTAISGVLLAVLHLLLEISALPFIILLFISLVAFVYFLHLYFRKIPALKKWHEAAEAMYENKSHDVKETREQIDAILERYSVPDTEAFLAYYGREESRREQYKRNNERIREIDEAMEELSKEYAPLLKRFALPFTPEGLDCLIRMRKLHEYLEEMLEGERFEDYRARVESAPREKLDGYESNRPSLEKKQRELERIERRITEKEASHEARKERHRPLATIEHERLQAEEETSRLLRKRKVYEKAKQLLEDVSTTIAETFSPTLEHHVGHYLERFTDDAYTRIKLPKSLDFRVEHPSHKDFEDKTFFSAGTLDQIYLAIRLGTLDALEKGDVPLILDDAFVNFDAQRLKRALETLDRVQSDRQILLFTCHLRESEALEELDIKHNHITLERG